jgi:hypothetical protein
MTLIPNWKEVLQKAWSIRFAIIAAAFSALEVICNMLDESVAPKGLMAGIGGLMAAGGGIARLLDQTKVTS